MTFTVMSLSLMHDTTLTAVRWHHKRPSFTSVGSDITERLLPVILNIKTRKITKYTLIYGKCPKISNIYSVQFWLKFCFLMHLLLKILSGMANSVDPDQTAPSGAV